MEFPFAVDVMRDDTSDVLLVRLLESLDAESVPRLAETLRILTERERKLVLDLQRCEIIVSTGIGVLHHYKTTAVRNGGDIALANVPPFVAKLIRMILGTELLPIFDTVDDAVKSVSSTNPTTNPTTNPNPDTP